MPPGLNLEIEVSDNSSNKSSSSNKSKSSDKSKSYNEELKNAISNFAHNNVQQKNTEKFIKSLNAIYQNGEPIVDTGFYMTTIPIAKKTKDYFVTYNDKTGRVVDADCVIEFFTTKGGSARYFYKKFNFFTFNKEAAAAIITKILAEIYYQQQAFKVSQRRDKSSSKRRYKSKVNSNFSVPKIFSYGTITSADPAKVNEKEYYIKMEYIEQEEFITLGTIINTYPFYQITKETKKKFGDMTAMQLCDSIVTPLRIINNILRSKQIYHNDLLNPDNVLINPFTKKIVIIDFGEASGKLGTAGKTFIDTIPDCEELTKPYLNSGLKQIKEKEEKTEGPPDAGRKTKKNAKKRRDARRRKRYTKRRY
jgi:serine/threonine protein kinase